MLSMTKKTGYGLIAMMHLARLDKNALASAREISEQYHMPTALLMNVLKELAAAGYVRSVRGARGGYCLSKATDDVDFLGLMEVLEGPMKFAKCVTGTVDDGNPEATCELMPNCPISDPVHRVHRKIRDYLSRVTLSDILSDSVDNAPIDPTV